MERKLRDYGTLCLIAILMVACNDVHSQQQKEVVEKKDTVVENVRTAENQHQCIADEPQGPIEPEEECFDKDYFEEMPEFPGGIDKMLVVEKDGTLSDFKVVRSLHKDCDAEAIRVLKTMPKWKPGKVCGKPIRVKYTVPVQFKKPVSQK